MVATDADGRNRSYLASEESFSVLKALHSKNLLVPVVGNFGGPKALRALALVSEVVYGAPASLRDPARFSFAHGGKDGHPYPVDRATYDHTVGWLRDALGKAKLGHTDRLHALRRLQTWEGA